jgi:hypothetical protein
VHHLDGKMNYDQSKHREHFWDWFDSLDPKQRNVFSDYKSDMAEIYFENKIWPVVSKNLKQKLSFAISNHGVISIR